VSEEDFKLLAPCSAECVFRDHTKPFGGSMKGGCKHLVMRGAELRRLLRAVGQEMARLRHVEDASRYYVGLDGPQRRTEREQSISRSTLLMVLGGSVDEDEQ